MSNLTNQIIPTLFKTSPDESDSVVVLTVSASLPKKEMGGVIFTTTDFDKAGEVHSSFLVGWRFAVCVQFIGLAVLIQAVEVGVQYLILFRNSALNLLGHNSILPRVRERGIFMLFLSERKITSYHQRSLS